MLTGALIGFGQVAEMAHAPAWRGNPDFRIAAVAEPAPARARLARRYFPSARIYPSPAAMLARESGLHFVDIATPPAMHASQTLAALKRGCHVLCEKPLALTLRDIQRIQEAANRKGKTAFTVHNWAYAPLFLETWRLLRSGAIGTALHAELHVSRSGPAQTAGDQNWRGDRRMSGGGILIDHGWHQFYLLQRILARAPTAVGARLLFSESLGVEDRAFCAVQCHQATAAIYLSWRSPLRSNWGVVYGTRGALEICDNALVVSGVGEPEKWIGFGAKLSEGSAHPDWFETMLKDFRSEISDPRERGRNLREAGVCLKSLLCAYRSHRTGGRPVPLPAYHPPLPRGIAINCPKGPPMAGANTLCPA